MSFYQILKIPNMSSKNYLLINFQGMNSFRTQFYVKAVSACLKVWKFQTFTREVEIYLVQIF